MFGSHAEISAVYYEQESYSRLKILSTNNLCFFLPPTNGFGKIQEPRISWQNAGLNDDIRIWGGNSQISPSIKLFQYFD